MMSRRKQLKPRALKRDDEDDDGLEEPAAPPPDETETNRPKSPESNSDGRQSPDEPVAPSCGEDGDLDDPDDDDDEEEENDGEYRCETCDSLFKSLNAFMDHRNFVCTGHHDNESFRARSRSSSPLSSTSDRKTPLSPLSVMTETNEADLLYSVGVDETHPYQCQFCERAYMRLSHLKKHEQVHADLLPFKCDYCLRLFRHKRSRDRHVKLHTGDKKHKCPKCDSAFARSDHLKIHLRSHDNGKPYRCQQCNRGYTNAAALSSHTIFHKRYGQSCNKTETTDEQAPSEKSPNQSPDPDPQEQNEEEAPLSLVVEKTSPPISGDDYTELICEFCLKTGFSNKDVLDMHIQMLHAGKSKAPYLCPFCNAAYPTFYNLAEHVRLLHEPMFMSSTPPYNCDICSKSYKSIHELASHREKIHKYPSTSLSSLTYLCPQCSMPCANQASLIEHMQLVHPPAVPMDNEYMKERAIFPSPVERSRQSNDSKSSLEVMHCDRCNLQFSDLTKFKDHIKTHVSSPPSNGQVTPTSNTGRFGCKECSSSFESEDQLETHTFMHYLSLTTEYGCTSCLKLFAKPDELQKHLMDIHAHHLYRCALCKEVFDSKVNVQVHFAVKHSNECKLYKCTVCSSIFRSEMEWQLHVKVNHLCLSKPYRCLFCKDSFSTEVELQCHLTEHKKQFPCPLCDEAFHVEYLLDKHMQNKHSPDEEKNSRPSSVKSSPQKELDGYSIKMESSELLSCQVCDVKFQDESQLLAHLVQNHQLSNMGQISPKSLLGSTSSQESFCNLCVYCNQNFKTKGDLERHMKSHSLPTSLKCNICDEVFPSTNILAEHKLIHCKVVQGNNCVVCKFSLKNESQFYFHAEQHGFQGTNMLCVICRQTLMSTVELNMHAKFHFQSSNSFYTCCVCLKSFNSKENLVAKLNSSGRAYYVCKPCYHGGEEEVGCQQCPKKFESQSDLDHHILVSHAQPTTPPKEEKPKPKQSRSFFTCCVCLKAFESQENLVPKLNASGRAYYVCKPCYHGNDPAEENRCTWCALTFPTAPELEAHVQIHKKSYQCIKCQQSFATEYEIQIHVATHMMQEGNVHECRLCGRIFDSPAKLQCHLIEHTFEQAEFRCYICEMTFATAQAIQSHVLDHGVAGRRYSCTQCSQKFFFTAELHNHLLSHTYLTENGTDFKCPECSATFTNVMVLNNHRRLHEPSQANIKCSLCPDTFSSIAEMQQHFFSAHLTADKEKRHKCTECQKEYNSQSLLVAHMKTSHSGKENRQNSLTRNSPPAAYFPLTGSHGLYGNQNGGKIHQCHVCAKPFHRRSALKEHMKCHSCQNPSLYKCEYCDDTFSQGRLLSNHVTDQHKQQYFNDISVTYQDRRSPQSNGSVDSAGGSDLHTVNDINENGINKDTIRAPPEMNGIRLIKRESDQRDDVTSAKRIKLSSPMLEVKIEPGLESVA